MSDKLPVECCVCKVIYKYIPAYREVKPGEISSGYCPECLPAIQIKLFGKREGK
jgi:hypothetical protein